MFGEALKIRVKKFKQNLPENNSKSTETAIAARKISKFFRRSMPPNPPRAFLVLNQLQISSAEKKYASKNVEIMPPLIF